MTLLSPTQNLLIISKASNKALFTDVDNKNLWKQALEKNALQLKLGKQDVKERDFVKEPKFDGLYSKVKNDLNFKSGFDGQLIDDSTISNKPKYLEKNLHEGKALMNFGIDNNSRTQRVDQSYCSSILNQYESASRVVQTEDAQIVCIPQVTLQNMKWLHKNALITVVNSNLEFWIRDNDLTGTRLKDVLRNIKQTMASLGASLSKISVNGQVVFNNEK